MNFLEHPTPVDENARRLLYILRLGKLENFTDQDLEAIRWKGAISRCPLCGDRAYLHGWCFGCGKPFA